MVGGIAINVDREKIAKKFSSVLPSPQQFQEFSKWGPNIVPKQRK